MILIQTGESSSLDGISMLCSTVKSCAKRFTQPPQDQWTAPISPCQFDVKTKIVPARKPNESLRFVRQIWVVAYCKSTWGQLIGSRRASAGQRQISSVCLQENRAISADNR